MASSSCYSYIIFLCITCCKAVNNYRKMLKENLVPFCSKQYRKKGKEQQTRRKKRIQRNCEPHPILEPDELFDWLAFGLLGLPEERRQKRLGTFLSAFGKHWALFVCVWTFLAIPFTDTFGKHWALFVVIVCFQHFCVIYVSCNQLESNVSFRLIRIPAISWHYRSRAKSIMDAKTGGPRRWRESWRWSIVACKLIMVQNLQHVCLKICVSHNLKV